MDLKLNAISSENQSFSNEAVAKNSFTSLNYDVSRVSTSTNGSKRNVRLVYCSDGVLEECDEDDEEKARLEKEAKEKELEARRKLDLEAKNMTWVPWMGYMVHKTAIRTIEACDYAGEKLAWWLGITKPKFLYEINEYEAMKREEERRSREEDRTEEIVIGASTTNKVFDPESNEPNDYNDSEMRLYNENEVKSGNKKALYQN